MTATYEIHDTDVRFHERLYQAPFDVAKLALGKGTEVIQDDAGKDIRLEVPKLTLTLEITGEDALSAAAHLAGFHQRTIMVSFGGYARQLTLWDD